MSNISVTYANNQEEFLSWILKTPHHSMSRIENKGHITLSGYTDTIHVPLKIWNSSMHLFTNTPRSEPRVFIPNEEGLKFIGEKVLLCA